MRPTHPAFKHEVEGYSFEELCAIADQYGYDLAYNPADGEGGGDEYELTSNEHAPGVTGVYETLAEATGDVLALERNEKPLG